VHAVFDKTLFPDRRVSLRVPDLFHSLPSTHNDLFDRHVSNSQHTPSPQQTQVNFAERPSCPAPLAHSKDHDDDIPALWGLDLQSDDNGNIFDVPTISVQRQKLDTTTTMPRSKYFDEYKFMTSTQTPSTTKVLSPKRCRQTSLTV